ncbi:hypothetical protein Cs7R123_35130 [Catellatospora sp. TT07R-123]|uniref:hypothetical protein n=1 Tax=Catellatospora sp. TT07R-123 TaxID=2733863 RepID=UPI001B003148|nr:hypothetical protein [Catellatospora sp. TT07R-123]GHJ46171.1 hypothetical protein Cs7R123_35130 [Catellatospora sp. TT07R-123]
MSQQPPPFPQWPAPQPVPQPQPQWTPPPPAGPAPVAYPAPVRVEPVPGTPYAVAVLPAPSSVSGVGIGALVTGIGSVLVSLVVWCLGLVGSQAGWGALVAGAFTVLSVLLGAAGIVLGLLARRQIRAAAAGGQARLTGSGTALTGLICGATGVALALTGVLVATLLVLGDSAPTAPKPRVSASPSR